MKRDSQIFDLIAAERNRQMHGIELIASENFVSDQVMEAMGSVLTNKYAEGYPGARYYGGCEVSTARSTPTCSPIRAHRPTWPFSSPACSRAIRSWDWTLHTEDTSRTVRRSTCRVNISRPWAISSTRPRA